MSNQTNMNYETNRLATFSSWPSSAPVNPARIAKAGFFYTGQGLEVQCFSCNSKISQWNYGDQVMWRHRRLSPSCTFVVDQNRSGNVPIIIPECSSPEGSWTTLDEGPVETMNYVDNTTQDYNVTEEDEIYRSAALRFLSFVHSWDDSSVSRESLVNAGFYHAGNGKVRCAWCGGELGPFRHFGSFGTPLEVHRMYFPRCDHARTLEAAQQMNLSAPSTLSFEIQTPPLTSPLNETNEPQSSGAAHNSQILNAGGTWRTLGVVGGGARHSHLAPLASRLATYERWPADRPQSPRTLAEAGFFHTGTDDQVRCFYCDGGLGMWEAGDAPWTEHARWFPHCGYVLLIKGQEFVDAARPPPRPNINNVRQVSGNSALTTNRGNPGITFPVSDSQIEESMESAVALGALSAGLDAARVRRAIVRRLRSTGSTFTTPEALIDAVLDEQLNEEAWTVTPQSQRFARDILAETLREFAPRTGVIQAPQSDNSDSRNSHSEHETRSPSPEPPARIPDVPPVREVPEIANRTEQVIHTNNVTSDSISENGGVTEKKTVSLEEENRQLKEARLCKVCMDNEVSVVFLPCGHLVSCAGCGAALPDCPLCRAKVKALVRAYLA